MLQSECVHTVLVLRDPPIKKGGRHVSSPPPPPPPPVLPSPMVNKPSSYFQKDPI